MKPYFSIIIPTLNEEKFVPKLLADLVKQKEKNFELIIIDAFSKDKTESVVNKFKSSLNLNFFKKKGNVSHGRNVGSQKAKGEYLIFLDADARINSNFTKLLLNTINKEKGLLFIPSIIPDSDDKDIKIIINLMNFFVKLSQNTNQPFSTGGSMVIEKYLFQRIGGFNEKIFNAEDHSLIQEAQKWGVRAKFQKNLELKFNLRRMRKEGKFHLLFKYFVSTSHLLLKGDIKEKIFDYEMGGHIYQKKSLNRKARQERIMV